MFLAIEENIEAFQGKCLYPILYHPEMTFRQK